MHALNCAAWMYASSHACAKDGYPRPAGCENETAGLWVYPRYVSTVQYASLLTFPPTF
jgi:hypothetical protein